MIDINPTISIITLNVNVLNLSIKRQRLSVFIKNEKKKERPKYILFERNPL